MTVLPGIYRLKEPPSRMQLKLRFLKKQMDLNNTVLVLQDP